jgi:hypothetical protein
MSKFWDIRFEDDALVVEGADNQVGYCGGKSERLTFPQLKPLLTPEGRRYLNIQDE